MKLHTLRESVRQKCRQAEVFDLVLCRGEGVCIAEKSYCILDIVVYDNTSQRLTIAGLADTADIYDVFLPLFELESSPARDIKIPVIAKYRRFVAVADKADML